MEDDDDAQDEDGVVDEDPGVEWAARHRRAATLTEARDAIGLSWDW